MVVRETDVMSMRLATSQPCHMHGTSRAPAQERLLCILGGLGDAVLRISSESARATMRPVCGTTLQQPKLSSSS